MKKLIIFIFLLLVGVIFINTSPSFQKTKNTETSSNQGKILTPSITTQSKEHSSLFVPYWSITQEAVTTDDYDAVIYFGITPTAKNINTNEAGYIGLEKFLASVDSEKEKILTLRMIDSKTNFAILDNKKSQNQIIAETITIARDNEFDGILLNLEVSALPFDSLIKQINDFTKLFYTEAKKNDLHFAITLYGDVYHRIRPFDVKTLAKYTDEVMIMAYDFHKARGNPGPNFPLLGNEQFGYDYEEMTADFLKDVPAEKLTIVFGLYGYDWTVDENGSGIGNGDPLSLLEIQSFLSDCVSCIVTRDAKSAETKVTYTKDGEKHVIWYEDEESVQKKQEFLKKKGITSSSFWAYSYF